MPGGNKSYRYSHYRVLIRRIIVILCFLSFFVFFTLLSRNPEQDVVIASLLRDKPKKRSLEIMSETQLFFNPEDKDLELIVSYPPETSMNMTALAQYRTVAETSRAISALLQPQGFLSFEDTNRQPPEVEACYIRVVTRNFAKTANEVIKAVGINSFLLKERLDRMIKADSEFTAAERIVLQILDETPSGEVLVIDLSTEMVSGEEVLHRDPDSHQFACIMLYFLAVSTNRWNSVIFSSHSGCRAQYRAAAVIYSKYLLQATSEGSSGLFGPSTIADLIAADVQSAGGGVSPCTASCGDELSVLVNYDKVKVQPKTNRNNNVFRTLNMNSRLMELYRTNTSRVLTAGNKVEAPLKVGFLCGKAAELSSSAGMCAVQAGEVVAKASQKHTSVVFLNSVRADQNLMFLTEFLKSLSFNSLAKSSYKGPSRGLPAAVVVLQCSATANVTSKGVLDEKFTHVQIRESAVLIGCIKENGVVLDIRLGSDPVALLIKQF